ncbi:hypothetical protein ACHAPO_009761 [Fusarium lateritium]
MHGLDAESPKTWIAWKKDDDPDSGDVNWLSDKHMLPSPMPDARILTYDWNAKIDKAASGDRFLGHADTFLDRALVRATERYHPRGPKYHQVLDFTVGVAFLGTPFSGSWGTGYTVADLRVAVAIESGGEYNRELMEYLRQGTPESPGPLDDLVQKFSEMIHHTDFKFGKVCFYETRHTNFSAYRKKLPKDYAAQLDIDGHGIVVTKSSACLQGVEGVALDVRHNMLHKFNSPENDGYQRLVSRLKDFAENAHVVLGVDDECNFICEPRDRSPSDKDGSSSFTKKLTLFHGYNDAYLGADEPLGWAVGWLRRSGYFRLPQIPEQLRNIDTISNLRRARVRWPLDALMSICQVKFHATDQRDKVYGLLGLSLENEDSSVLPGDLKPDYSIDVPTLYQRVARYLLKRNRSLAILNRAKCIDGTGTRKQRVHDLNLPSWCPDWSDFNTYNEGISTSLGFPKYYQASGGLEANLYESETGIGVSPVLQLGGFIVDRVAQVCRFSFNPSIHKQRSGEHDALMAPILRLAFSLAPASGTLT